MKNAGKKYHCRFCGTEIKPPEVAPPILIEGVKSDVEIISIIKFNCWNCGEKQQDHRSIKILIDKINLKVKD